jgi:GAF domain-containing protein
MDEDRDTIIATVLEISSIPARFPDHQSILDLAMDKAGRVLRSDTAILYLKKQAQDYLSAAAVWGIERSGCRQKIPLKIDDVYLGGQLLLWTPNTTPPFVIEAAIGPIQFESAVGVPIYDLSELIGWLFAARLKSPEYSELEVSLFPVLADRLATAFSTLKAVAGLPSASEINQESWRQFLQRRDNLGYVCDASDRIHQIHLPPSEEAIVAAQKGNTIQTAEGTLAIPIKIRDYVAGVVSLKKPSGQSWQADEVQLMETITEQLGAAVESARLYNDTQLRAERERLITEITSRVRASSDLDAVMQTAVGEIARALESPRGTIVLRSDLINREATRQAEGKEDEPI